MKKILLIMLLAAFAVTIFANEKITVYLSGPEQMIKTLEKTFEETRGDVLNIFHTGCGPLRQKVWAEMESGKMHADVIWGSDPLIFFLLQEKGLLENYVSSQEKMMKDEYLMENCNFVLANARYGVIIYSKEYLDKDEVPASFAELTDKRWKGLVGIADLNFSSTALAIVSSMWEMFDKNWGFFSQMKANDILMVRKNSEVPSRIEEGEIDLGIAPHDGVLRLQKKAKKEGYNSTLAISWPEEGAISLERPLGIVKDENRSEEKSKLTHEFVDFMLSKKAQKITTNFGFISVREDIEFPDGMPKEFPVFKVDWKFLADNQIEIREEFKELMLK